MKEVVIAAPKYSRGANLTLLQELSHPDTDLIRVDLVLFCQLLERKLLFHCLEGN